MMNWIMTAIASFGLLTPAAFAVPVNLTCTTDPLTTSVAIFTSGNDITFRVINHNGADAIPLSKTIITPGDLANLTQKAKDLAQLGDQYDIHLTAAQCTVTAQKLLDCSGTTAQTINGHKISYFSLDTATTTTVSALYATPYTQTWVNLSLTMDGKDYDFSMAYNAGGCVDTSSSVQSKTAAN